MKQSIVEIVNAQIRAEFQAAYFYLAYAARFDLKGLPGFAAWMRKQWQEELEHGLKFYDFLLRRGASVELHALDKPAADSDSPVKVFERVLDHERHVTERIHKMYELAQAEKDYPLQTLLHWFIDEQVEEEDNAAKILDRLKMIGDSGAELYLLDKELGGR
ncbi:MAG: ferritin [Rhodothermales bacterium]